MISMMINNPQNISRLEEILNLSRELCLKMAKTNSPQDELAATLNEKLYFLILDLKVEQKYLEREYQIINRVAIR